ncbi:MAG: hypothetical protein EXQ89_00945 [Rhodospirillaceae bacterium]|nr:hypothetical protein [Rhodospirillaceae bacterium]
MPKTIALDANLLILLVVGLANPDYVRAHKRLRKYGMEDFTLLRNLISVSAGVIVTPNVLSEASNLSSQIKDPEKTHIAMAFRKWTENITEIYVQNTDASSRKEFLRIGLSDCSLLEVGNQNIAILSDDLGLCLAAQHAGYESINFTHQREGLNLV